MCAVFTHICDRCRVDILLSKKGNLLGLPHSRTRCCRTVEEIYGWLGAHYFWQAYCMTYEFFLFFTRSYPLELLRLWRC
jgi:hypothetical protein